MTRIAPGLFIAALLVLACGLPEPDQPPADEKQQQRLTKALESLSTAPDRVRVEVLKTCDKWKHIDHPCDEEQVRTEQLECWLEDGLPYMKRISKRRFRDRARALNILLRQNLCMELRRWRKLKRGPDF